MNCLDAFHNYATIPPGTMSVTPPTRKRIKPASPMHFYYQAIVGHIPTYAIFSIILK